MRAEDYAALEQERNDLNSRLLQLEVRPVGWRGGSCIRCDTADIVCVKSSYNVSTLHPPATVNPCALQEEMGRKDIHISELKGEVSEQLIPVTCTDTASGPGVHLSLLLNAPDRSGYDGS